MVEMIDRPNGTYLMGNGLVRQQRHIRFGGVRVCVFRVRQGDAWEDRWSAEVPPGPHVLYDTYVSRTTFRKAVTDAVEAARRHPEIKIVVR